MKYLFFLLLFSCAGKTPDVPYTVESLTCQSVQKTDCGLTLYDCDNGATVICYKPAGKNDDDSGGD